MAHANNSAARDTLKNFYRKLVLNSPIVPTKLTECCEVAKYRRAFWSHFVLKLHSCVSTSFHSSVVHVE